MKTLATPRGILAAGSAYALLYVGVTGFLPPPASPTLRLLAADALLLLPTLVALASTLAAARRSLGVERAFWSLLAGAAAVQTLNEGAYAAYVLFPREAWLAALAYGAYHAFFALVGASLLVWPHRPLAPQRMRAATLEWLMGAAALAFLISSFVALPYGQRATRWLWIYTIQVALIAAAYLALALRTRQPPFRGVYAILAGGFGASALVQVVPHALRPVGAGDLYSPVHVDWVLTLTAMAAAARAPRAVSWMRAVAEDEPSRLRSWLAAAAVPLPLLVDVALRVSGVQPALAAERTQIALASSALLAVMAAVRAYGARAAGTPAPAATQESAEDSSQYLQFASGVAHELNNPLTVVAGWAELGLKRAAPRLPLEQLLAATRHAAGVVARLQRLSHAAGAPPSPDDAAEGESGPQSDTGAVAAESHQRRVLRGYLFLAVGFLLVHSAVRSVEPAPWWGDAMLALPAAAAGVLLVRRGRASRTARRRAFWQLLAAGPLTWAAAELYWAGLRARGIDPAVTSVPSLDILFLGFLIPLLGAVALRPHRPAGQLDPVAAADVGIVSLALSFLFLRAVILPLGGTAGGGGRQAVLLGILSWVLAVWTAALWRTVPQPGWRRVYGLLALFAVSYGTLSAAGNGFGRGLPPPGGWTDVAWTVPFLFLGLAALSRRRGASERRRGSASWAVAAGAGVYIADALARVLLPLSAVRTEELVLVGACALIGLAYAARLLAGDAAVRRLEADARRQADEMRRAGRLGAIAGLAADAVADLGDALEEVARLAVHASRVLPGQGRHVVAQAERAREIVRELAESFRLAPVGPRRPVDVGGLVEQTVQQALDQGLGLHVRVEGLAGLPRVWGDPAALGSAVHHLLRNAAQASPGGVLRVSGGIHDGWVEVRLADDGPGVPGALRSRIFDPFFTTRRVGEGLGLGLTLVHFVARSHGGSVFLDDGRPGATFVLRLPAYDAAARDAVRTTWPWAAAAAAAAALATALAVLPAATARMASLGLQVAAPLVAVGFLLRLAWRRPGPERAFWGLLAAAPALWTLSRTVRIWQAGWDWQPVGGMLAMSLFALGDLAWPAALLLRADRPPGASGRLSFGAGAVLCVFAYAHLNLLVLPDPFALSDPTLRMQLGILRAVQRTSLVVWAAVLAWRAWSPRWRRRYAQLAGVFVVFAAGYTAAFSARGLAGYRAGSLTDLGWVLPFLFLGALAWRESLVEDDGEPAVATVAAPAPSHSAAWLLALAAIVALDTLLSQASGHAGLDGARGALTRAMVVAMALILAARELGGGEGWPRRRWSREVGSSRLLKVMAAALHELGGHVSGMASLGRLLQAQTTVSPRGQADAQRILDRGEAATRIIRNLLEALPRPSTGEPVRLDDILQEVVTDRRESLAAGRVDLSHVPCPDVPGVIAHPAALRHAFGGLLDHAVGQGAHRVELATSVSGECPLVTLVLFGEERGADAATSGLDLVHEVLAREGAELVRRSRPAGGVEYVVRFDRGPAGPRGRTEAWPGSSAAAR